HHRIHLCARELHADRLVQNLRGDRRYERVRPDVTLSAEAAAKEFRHDIDLRRRYTEHDRDELLRAEDVLGRFIKGERAPGVPYRYRRVWLHLVVMPIGDGVGLLDLDRRGRDCLVGVAGPRGYRPSD